MIKAVRLTNFKGFSSYQIAFRGDAFLIGPNNAGKSTVIAALRAAANMIRIASRNNTTHSLEVDGFRQAGHWFSSNQIRLIEENLRHEFSQRETRLKVDFSSGATLEAVWPVDEDGGFFFVLNRDDVNLMRAAAVRDVLPATGVVPVLAPVDHTEELLSENYVRGNLDGRLASRHFRNQLHLLKKEDSETHRDRLHEFLDFAEPWTPELSIEDLQLRRADGRTSFDLNYKEPESRIDKELFWAGDGMQIWIQLLLHLFRLKDRDVVVLDEPDVFLHADLQRRLVDLVETLDAQSITATHSAEVISEARSDSIIWVSRDRKRAIRAPSGEKLVDLSTSLGTRVDLPLARALKTKVVVFVEGQDARLLKNVAAVLGLHHVAKELGVTLIPLDGFDRWEDVKPFKWLVDEFLQDRVEVHVLLDRDYRDDGSVAKVMKDLRTAKVKPHVWKRHEIENYLLSDDLLARQSGATVELVRRFLEEASAELETDVYAGVYAEEARTGRKRRDDDKTISKRAKARADKLWKSEEKRLEACPGKDVLRILNGKLQAAGHSAVGARPLAANAQPSDIPQELKTFLSRIEREAGVR